MNKVITDDNTIMYTARKNCLFVNKVNNYIMGESIEIYCNTDSIDNYEEKEYSQDEYEKIVKTIYKDVLD